MSKELARRVQVAMFGEVPSSLRFLYVGPDGSTMVFHAVFTDEATDEHLECAEHICHELNASYYIANATIERNSTAPWQKWRGENLRYLRWGEFSDT